MNRLKWIMILIFGMCSTLVLAQSVKEVILVNRPDSEKDKRYEFAEKLLRKILETTQDKYGVAVVQQSELPMSRDRIFQEMIKGEVIHVTGEAVKPEWEEKLIPIYIPIRKGIQGFRIFLIKKGHQPLLSAIKSLEGLKKIPTGTSAQWSTTRALKENGFDVVEGSDYEGLFTMLYRDRFITFNRGINEVFAEYDARKDQYPDLAVEQELLLYIPLPTYFFVTPTKPLLAKRIQEGFLKLIDEGTFDHIFNEEFGALIKTAKLDQRRIFKISNPNLSAKTPLNVERYWYRPSSIR